MVNQVTSASLRYPLSVFNKNSTLRRENHGKIFSPRRHSLRGLLVFGSGMVQLYQTWISLLVISTLVRWSGVVSESAVVDMKSEVLSSVWWWLCASSAPLTSLMTLTHNSSTMSCSIGGIPGRPGSSRASRQQAATYSCAKNNRKQLSKKWK